MEGVYFSGCTSPACRSSCGLFVTLELGNRWWQWPMAPLAAWPLRFILTCVFSCSLPRASLWQLDQPVCT